MYASNYSFIGTSSSSMASTQHPRDIKIQECVFRADRKTKMTALSESEWLRYIRLPLRTEFDQTWQEARAQCLLQVSLCQVFRTNPKTKMTTLVSDWLRDFQLLLFNRLRNGIWQNLTWSKYSMSSTKFLFFFFEFFFFWGGGRAGWPEFAENKYVRVVNFTACRTCYDSPIVWLASRLCLITY